MHPLAESADPTEALPADAVEVGRILGPWGVKGWVHVQAYAAEPEALFSSRQWWLGAAGQARRWRVAQSKEHGSGIVAQLHDVLDRSAALALKGLPIWVPRTAFPTPADDEYYWVDLIGLEVVNREGVTLGQVTELFATGPTSVLRVRRGAEGDPEARETMIPFVNAYVDEVQLPERRIRVDWGVDD
jgi:16S rRNA processing protein RimM